MSPRKANMFVSIIKTETQDLVVTHETSCMKSLKKSFSKLGKTMPKPLFTTQKAFL